MSARLGTWLAILLICQACKSRDKPNESNAAAKATTSHPSLQRVGAFDLASSDAGAVLIVAEKAQLRMTLLDVAGRVQKTETLYTAEATREPGAFPEQESFEIEGRARPG
jgi:hypothetical protein